MIGGQYGIDCLLQDDSGKLLTQALYPKDYCFTYLMNPCSAYLFDRKYVQIQALAAIKFLIATTIFKDKENASKIIHDIEETLEIDFDNNLKYWKSEGVYQ